ncbi:MAG: NUDIX hydrolase [Clostridia bacterium]|nr:NUDIX hydrolase [Clostridia bacterium]
MKLEEKKISSKEVFDGKVINVTVDAVELPNGAEGVREIVHHRGAVCVLPLTDDGDVICVRQFRYAHGEVLLEIPAGKLEEGEHDHRAAALRELSEETGAECSELIYLGKLYPSPAIFTEVIHMYLARGLTFGETHPDDDEFLEIERIPLEKLKDMVMRGEIYDAKTQICVMRAYLEKGK